MLNIKGSLKIDNITFQMWNQIKKLKNILSM